MKYLLLFFVLIVLNFYANIAAARDNAIAGRVANEVAKPLPDANVILLNAKDSALLKTEVTDDSGNYRFAVVGGWYVHH